MVQNDSVTRKEEIKQIKMGRAHTEVVHVGVLNSYPVQMMMTAMRAVMNDWNHRKTRPLSTQKPCTAYPSLLHVPPTKEEDCRELKRQQQS